MIAHSPRAGLGIKPRGFFTFRRRRMDALARILCIWAALSSGACGAELRVGAAAVNITPPTGIGLAGYYFERGAQGTNDDLFSKAIVLEHDGEEVALVALDLISTTRWMVEAARREIQETTKLRSAHVMISATHAHTGPVLARRGAREAEQGGETEVSLNYSASLPKRIAESVRLAASRLEPARLAAGMGREESLSFNRRYFMKDGTVRWNPGKLNTNSVRAAGPIDPDLGVVLFEGARARAPFPALATYINFAMHPDTVGGENFSADYPGALSRSLASYKGTNMLTLFANGTCGNINHVDVNWANPQKGPNEAHRIGTILAAEIFQTYKRLQAVKPGPLRVRSEMVKLPLPEVSAADLEQARATVKRYTMKDNSGFIEKVQAYKVLDVAAREGKPHEVEVQVIALGPELAWVSLPGEIFVELGLAIKRASPFKYTLIAELANGSIGYVPDQAAYAQGAYEVISARCAEGSGEILARTAVKLLKELHEKASP
jgi:hypothetical protein